MSPEHAGLPRLVDRFDPDQVRALVPRPGKGPEAESLLADEPVRDFSFIGLLNGAPDLAERSGGILREEFARPADADH